MKRFILMLTACSTLITQSAIAAPTKPVNYSPPMITAKIAPNTAIARWTDTFFYNVNPKLPRGQKLRPTDRAYIREWKAIRPVVQDVLVYKEISCGPYTQEFDWTLREYDGDIYPPRRLPPPPRSISSDINRLADVVFATRHPELMGRKIRPNETDFIRQWQTIRRQLSTLDPCY